MTVGGYIVAHSHTFNDLLDAFHVPISRYFYICCTDRGCHDFVYEHHRNFICSRQHSHATQTWYFPNVILNVTEMWRRSKGSNSSATKFLQLQIFEKKKIQKSINMCVCLSSTLCRCMGIGGLYPHINKSARYKRVISFIPRPWYSLSRRLVGSSDVWALWRMSFP